MLEDGTLVQYGELPGMWRAGYIVGHYTHQIMGEVYCVRTPHNAIAGQQFDPVPVEKVRPATREDLQRSLEHDRREALLRCDEFIDEAIAVIGISPNDPALQNAN